MTDLDEHIQRLVDEAPPLTAEQTDRLRAIAAAAVREASR